MVNQLLKGKHYFFLICVCLIWYSTPVDVSYWNEGSWLGTQKFIIYNAFMGVVIWSSFYFKGFVNKFIIVTFMAVLVLEVVSFFYLLYALQDKSLYLKICIAPLSSGICYIWFRYYPIAALSIVCKTKLKEKMKLRLSKLSKPTDFYFLCRSATGYFLLFEIITATYIFIYIVVMGISSSGSVYQTETDNNHISWNYFHEIGISILTLLFIYFLIKAVLKDWEKKDALPERLSSVFKDEHHQV